MSKEGINIIPSESGDLRKSVGELLDLVDRRNQVLGWARYDWSDLDSLPWLFRFRERRLYRPLRLIIHALDQFSPRVVHSLLRVSKCRIPTAYTHIGQACLVREQHDTATIPWEYDRIVHICEELIELRLPGEHLCWEHPYIHHGCSWRLNCRAAPPSCAHHTSRGGCLLVQAGVAKKRKDLIDAGVSAAQALLTYHNWTQYNDGTWVVSYYPFTKDETINTAAEVAVLFAYLTQQEQHPEMANRLVGIVKMILSEQLPSGSWNYCTARHYENSGETPIIDNHHSAQVIQALSRILCSGAVDKMLTSKIIDAIRRGIKYYLDEFYDQYGIGYYYPGRRGMQASIAGYGEGLVALYWAWQSNALNHTIYERVKFMTPKIMAAATRLLDLKTGDVACNFRFGMRYNIQSLRWGSGPFFEGLSCGLVMCEKM